MRVVFMGTPDFAVPSLEITAKEHELLAVVTQPDRKRDRGQNVKFSPIKDRALAYDVPIYQPEKVSTSEFIALMEQLNPDVIVVVAFGQKIPKALLELPAHGCINVHASLLPQYRGAAPIQYAIINGDQKTGVTTMYLNEGWDEGDMILQAEEPIYPSDTAGTLHDRLAVKGAELLGETLRQIEAGTAPRIPQDHEQATYAYKLEKSDGEIDWNLNAVNIHNLVRGLNPWPTAYTYLGKEMLKLWETEVVGSREYPPGEILEISPQGILVGTPQGGLLLKQVQRQGSRMMAAYDAANGLRMKVGQVLGAHHDN